ncbi:MAG: YbjN domain-containing protein, partial [Pseudomonadota bacterium]
IIDRDFAYDRPADDEIVAEISGIWCNYKIWFSWQPEHGGLIFSCSLDTKTSKAARNKVYPLLALVNEKLYLGHFDVSGEDNAIAFRHTMLMRGGCVLAIEQIEDLIDIASQECERFFPAFQSVIWGGKNANDALAAAIFETVGQA